MEICGNGIDDDGDGLIDCFDGDCAGVGDCEEFFFGQPVPDCNYQPPEIEMIELNLLFKTDESRYPIDQRSGVVVGDMNGDGVPDLVSRDNSPARIHIYSGDDGRILQSIVTPRTHPFGQVAIADVDADGLGDMFHIEYTGVLARYEFGSPNAVWRTANSIGDDVVVSTPQIADINQDGIPEIYVGDRVFDSRTGRRLADGGNINTGGYATGGNGDRFPIYFDLYQPGDPRPDGSGNFGPEAAGMEYIAGNQVYTVTFDPNGAQDNGRYQLAAQYAGPANLRDGFTSIADINGDGRMDIAVMDAGDVYAWDPYTNEIIGQSFQVPATSSGGRINIGDFDGDGDVELGFAGRNTYIVRDYSGSGGNNNGTWSTLWQKTGLDDGSQRTGSTLFDFDGNGTVEVVYSEEENLFIYDGTTGNELFRIQSRAGTRTEYPIVADVNGDGTAEIVVTAQELNGPQFSGTGWISVYESANQPWVPARGVWNQHGYNVTNINDDLTVPQFQQDNLNPGLGQRYNNFLVQTAVGGGTEADIRYPAADAIIAADSINGLPNIDFSDCPNTITLVMRVDNAGSAPLPASTPISFYDGDPRTTSPNLISTTIIGAQVDEGQTQLVPVTINVSAVPPGSPIFLSVNDPGFAPADLPFEDSDFPLTGTAECDYTNNVNNVGNVRCGEVCGDGMDNDGDNLIDEPNLFQPQNSGCPGAVLQAITNDSPGGAYSVVGGSPIGTTVTQGGVVTLGITPDDQPVTETIRYDDGICFEDVMVTTVDNVPPRVGCPGNATVAVDADCLTTLANYTTATQVSDNCSTTGDIVITQMPAAASSLNIGVNTVTITATDPNGNAASCTFTVTAVDRIQPTIDCPANTPADLDADCQYSIPDLTGGATVMDNCSTNNIQVAQTPVRGQVRTGHGRTVMVTLTATDEAGNSQNCTYTITLQDVTPPVITCPTVSDQTLSDQPGACSFNLSDYRGQVQRQDNCTDRSQITLTQSPAPGTAITAPGTTTITITATDAAGNSTNCTFDQEVIDRDPPQLTCAARTTVDVNPATCDYTVPNLTGATQIVDNCATSGFTVTQLPTAGSTFTGDFLNVTVTATDASGNANTCVTVLLPGDPPAPAIICPTDDELVADVDCAAVLPDYTGDATTTGCGTITVRQSPAAGTRITANTTVTLTATNNSGGSTSCTFEVTLLDETPPTVACPATQTIAVDGTCRVPLPDYSGQASTMDNCDPTIGAVTVAQSPVAGALYDINDSPVTVTLTATDASNNTAACSFQVQLMDNQPPTISCPVSPQISMLDASCQTMLPDFTNQVMVSSTCAMGGFTLVQRPAPGTTVSGVQTLPVTITATDDVGNDVMCTFDFETVDMTAPTVVCPADRTEVADGGCAFTTTDYTGLVSATDNCSTLAPASPPNITLAQSSSSATIIGDGSAAIVTLTATDAAGNSANCSFTVTLDDTTPPVLTCPADQTEDLDAGCAFVVPDYTPQVTVTDNCLADGPVTYTQAPPAGSSVTGDGTVTTITITGTDANGNAATCAFTLTVNDAMPPTISCPPNPTIEVDDACIATVPNLIADATTADNCTLDGPVVVTQNITAGTTLTGDGTTQLVTLTATDANGLTATCDVTITLDDVTPPTVTCPAAQDVNLDATGCSVLLPDFSGQLLLVDNCDVPTGAAIQQTPAAGTVVTGANTVQNVTFNVTDGNGNEATCNFNVTLKDVTDPTVVCPTPGPLTLDENCSVALPDFRGQATAMDDCAMTAAILLTQSPAAGTNLTFNGASQTVTITANDGNGNSVNCSFTVAAEDTTMPTIVCPADRDEDVSANCDFALPDYTGEAAVTDNCSDEAAITITQSPAVGTVITEAGLNQPQTITLTAEDAAGNTRTCTFEITPVDRAAPTIICPAPQTILLDASCDATLGDLTALATAVDNCSDPAAIVLTQDIPATMVYDGLVPPSVDVTLTAEDDSGNTATCVVSVNIVDEIDPTVDCSAASVTIALDENCNGELPDLIPTLVTDDNCSAGALTVIQDPAAGAAYGGDGTTVEVTFTVTDASGNAVTCVATVTFEDQSPPNPVVCPEDQDLNVDDQCPVDFPDYTNGVTVLDNCRAEGDIILTQSPTPDSTVFLPIGMTTLVIPVTITANDGNGNTATCTFDVTLRDEDALDVACPGGQLVIAGSENCDGELEDYTGLVTAVNECMAPADGATFVQMPAAGTPLDINDLDVPQTVTITVTDANNNPTSCDFLVTLVDTLAPIIECPADLTLAVDEACSFAFNDYREEATILDNCTPLGGLVITQDPMPGAAITGPDAQQTIIITATDPSGNRSQCTYVLTIVDSLPPNLACPMPDTLLADADCNATVGDYRSQVLADDNCTNKDDVVMEQTPPPGTVINGHLTTVDVTIRATDASGNDTMCMFTVTVVDSIPPMITCPGDRVIAADGMCNAPVPDYRNQTKFSDNCALAGSITVTQRPAPGTVLSGDGTTAEVTIVADDGNGNRDSCAFVVTVEDNTPPTITCPADVTIDLDADCSYDLADLTADAAVLDNCTAVGQIIVTQNVGIGETLTGEGTIIDVTLTADDRNGNTAQCVTRITLEDTMPPTIACPATQTQFTDASCRTMIADYTSLAVTEDNCGDAGAVLVLSQVPTPGTTFAGVQDVVVTLTADDGNGNTRSCFFTVTLDDDDPPKIACPPAQVIDFGVDCRFTLPDFTADAALADNCAANLLTVTQSPSPDTLLSDLNTAVEVVLTVTDASGNQARCVFPVTTTSVSPPPAMATVMLAVINPPTGSGVVDLTDAFDPLALNNLSNVDLDAQNDVGFVPFLVSFYPTVADADAELNAFPAANFNPAVSGEAVLARIEDPTSGCFVLSQILLKPRSPGTSGAQDVVQCNKPGSQLKIDGQPVPGGQGTTIMRHEWRLISSGTTRITNAYLMQTDGQVLMVTTTGLQSGTFVVEYQFFEDYGDGPVVPSVPEQVTVEVLKVGSGDFFWDGGE